MAEQNVSITINATTPGLPETVSQWQSLNDGLTQTLTLSPEVQSALANLTGATQANTTATQALTDKLGEHSASAKTATESHNVLADALTRVGGAAGVSGEQLGVAGDSLKAFAASGEAATAATAALGVGVAALAAGAVAEATNSFVDLADEIRSASEITGVSQNTLQAFGYAAQSVGESSSGAQQALTILSRNVQTLGDSLAQGKTPSDNFTRALGELHINMQTFVEANPDQRLRMIMDAFAQLPPGADKGALAMDLLGRSGAALAPVLSEGTGLLNQMSDSMEAAGASVAGHQDEVLKLHDATTQLDIAEQGLKNTIGEAVVPILASATAKTVEFITAVKEGATELDALTGKVGGLGGVLNLAVEPGHALTSVFSGLPGPVKDFLKVNEDLVNPVARTKDAFGLLGDALDHVTGSHKQAAAAEKEDADAQQQSAEKAQQAADSTAGLAESAREAKADTELVTQQQKLQYDGLTAIADIVPKITASTQQQATFQQQLASAIQQANAPLADQNQRNLDLAASIQTSTGLEKTAEEQQLLLNIAVQQFGPQAVEATVQQQAWKDALAGGTAAIPDTVSGLNELISHLNDTGKAADDAQAKLLGMFTKPTPAELQAKAVIADEQAGVENLNAKIANTAPIDQRIAALVKQLDQEQKTGASADQVTKTRQELDANLAAATDQSTARQVVSWQTQIDKQNDVITQQQANLKADETQRASLQATADMVTNTSAPKLDDLQRALQVVIDKNGGLNGTGDGGLPSVTTNTQNAGNAAGTAAGQWNSYASALEATNRAALSLQSVALAPWNIPGLGNVPAAGGTGGGGASMPASAGMIMPASWYAAIQANESLLPLPSPGSPQPMFGRIGGAPHSVGTGYYASGGSNVVNPGQPGTTNQSLFPSVDAGIADFNSLVQSYSVWPQAQAAIQAGDFAGFLQIIAPYYATGSETADWPAQVLSHYSAGASLPGATGGMPGTAFNLAAQLAGPGAGTGGGGQNPVAAPTAAAAKGADWGPAYAAIQDVIAGPNAPSTLEHQAALAVAQAIESGNTGGAVSVLSALPASSFDAVISQAKTYIDDDAKQSGADVAALENSLIAAGQQAAPAAARNIVQAPDMTALQAQWSVSLNPTAASAFTQIAAQQVAGFIQAGDETDAVQVLAHTPAAEFDAVVSGAKAIIDAAAAKANTSSVALDTSLVSAASAALPSASKNQAAKPLDYSAMQASWGALLAPTAATSMTQIAAQQVAGFIQGGDTAGAAQVLSHLPAAQFDATVSGAKAIIDAAAAKAGTSATALDNSLYSTAAGAAPTAGKNQPVKALDYAGLQNQINAALNPTAASSIEYVAAQAVAKFVQGGDVQGATEVLAHVPADRFDAVVSAAKQIIDDAATRAGQSSTQLDNALYTSAIGAAPTSGKNYIPPIDWTLQTQQIDTILHPTAQGSLNTDVADAIARAIQAGDLTTAVQLLSRVASDQYDAVIGLVRQRIDNYAQRSGADANALEQRLSQAAVTAAPAAALNVAPNVAKPSTPTQGIGTVAGGFSFLPLHPGPGSGGGGAGGPYLPSHPAGNPAYLPSTPPVYQNFYLQLDSGQVLGPLNVLTEQQRRARLVQPGALTG